MNASEWLDAGASKVSIVQLYYVPTNFKLKASLTAVPDYRRIVFISGRRILARSSRMDQQNCGTGEASY